MYFIDKKIILIKLQFLHPSGVRYITRVVFGTQILFPLVAPTGRKAGVKTGVKTTFSNLSPREGGEGPVLVLFVKTLERSRGRTSQRKCLWIEDTGRSSPTSWRSSGVRQSLRHSSRSTRSWKASLMKITIKGLPSYYCLTTLSIASRRKAGTIGSSAMEIAGHHTSTLSAVIFADYLRSLGILSVYRCIRFTHNSRFTWQLTLMPCL